MHYYQLNIKSYQAATLHLTNEEDLAYRRLMDLYYDTELPISAKPNKATALRTLSRRLRVGMPELEIILDEFFIFDDECWKNEYCDQVIAEYHAFQEKQRANGRKGGRGNKAKDNPNKPTALPKEPKPKPTINNKQETINQINTKTKAKPSIDPVFESIWKIYPKRPGASKADTLKAYKARLNAGVVPKTMLEGASEYANYCKVAGIEPQYIKQPATFFGPNEHYLSDWTPPKESGQTKDLPLATNEQIEHAYRVECGGDPTQARFGSYMEMRKFIVDRREKRRVGV